jgi:phosphatidylserine/phosphatidylglycerophosphate/cardiolipin synthase-like enzyme
MRERNPGESLSIRAISGSHVVILAWDLNKEKLDTQDLLGFAIERTEYESLERKKVVERYFLRGIKRFRDKDKGLPPGTPVLTAEHPIQAFQWGDYTPNPGTAYSYRLIPIMGEVKKLDPRDDLAITVDIDTEPLDGLVHSVFFNRGVAGSQAYAREFPDPKPNPDDPLSPQMKWLSRGLYDALTEFINRAKDKNYGLRAALYEFHYEPVGETFKAALGRKVDVKILYDKPNYGGPNEKMIAKCGLTKVCAPRNSGGAQKHNKFIVLLRNGKPVEVWTGSTNVSDGGIFGHSNVGHIVSDANVAQAYFDYWTDLCNPKDPPALASKPFSQTRTDPGTSVLAKENKTATPTPNGVTAANTITPLFSPRGEDSLQWYADRMSEGKEIVCFMVAFTLAENFEPFLEADSNVLRYVLSDKKLKQGDLITRDNDVLYAAGAKFDGSELPDFRSEKLTGLNNNLYIHDKFMLIDPLGEDPTTVTGSANFSKSSQTNNDENMLVIRSDKRVADLYFGEFMRLFNHHYARYLAAKIEAEQKAKKKSTKAKKGSGGYLWPDSSWVSANFGDGPKSRRRQYFHGAWKPEKT